MPKTKIKRLPGERASEAAMRLAKPKIDAMKKTKRFAFGDKNRKVAKESTNTKPTKARGKAVAASSTATVKRSKNKAGETEVTFVPPASGIVAVVCERDPRHTDIDSHVIADEFAKGKSRCGCGANLVQRMPK